jgi:hypothetical protein
MFGDLILVLRWNFKVLHALELVIHPQIPKSKTPTNSFEF